MNILVLNAGSSSLKGRLYNWAGEIPPEPTAPLWSLNVDWSRRDRPARINVSTASGARLEREVAVDHLRDEFVPTIETLWSGETRVVADRSHIDVVGHRVVHGGDKLIQATRITPEVAEAIDELALFAPVHNPIEWSVIEAMEWILGRDVSQVAVFDTAFHSTLEPAAYVYGGPYEWLEKGIRRYGFHGISHQYVSRRTARMLGRELESLRLVTCHLGGGCSLAAIRGGESVDTTMGFTPLDGLIMSTRSGSVDPGILIHLLEHGGYSAERLDEVLNRESGLKGISGVSGDMREVLAAIADGNPRARLAFDAFVHRLRSLVGSMIAVLGGVDALIFTAGIGENSPDVRSAVCKDWEFLGLELDREKNTKTPDDLDVSTQHSKVRVMVIHTQEDWEIAVECCKLMRTTPPVGAAQGSAGSAGSET
jgi:acetate kinase